MAAAILRGVPSAGHGVAIVKSVGFEGETTDAEEYAKWLGSRHSRRVWGKLMSNANALIIELIVQRGEKQVEAGDDTPNDDRPEQTIDQAVG